jgi:hypothetical protein
METSKVAQTAEVHFLTATRAPPRAPLKPLDKFLADTTVLTPVGIFAALRDGWRPTLYLGDDCDILVNPGFERLGLSILEGDRAAESERQAERAREAV